MGMLRDDVASIIGHFGLHNRDEHDIEGAIEAICARVYPRPEGAGSVVSTEGREVAICGRADWTLWLPEHRAARPEMDWWEKPRLESMWHNLRPGDVLFDIGTEEGDLSALFARWVASEDEFVDGGIVLVEPNPMVWPNVKAIFEHNDIAAPLACFVGFTGAEEKLRGAQFDAHFVDAWPPCADGPMIGDHGFLNICERPDVPAVTIDWLVRGARAPDAITMDIEGAELLALRGAERTLREHKPLVWVSIHPEFSRDMYGLSRDDLLAYMAGLGYQHEHLAAEHEQHALFWHPEGRKPVLPYGGV